MQSRRIGSGHSKGEHARTVQWDRLYSSSAFGHRETQLSLNSQADKTSVSLIPFSLRGRKITPPSAFGEWHLYVKIFRECYWFSGLKVSTPASVFAQAPSGSTRTTESSSEQKARMPV